MRVKSWSILGIAVVALTIGLWVESPRLTQADPHGNGNGKGNGKGNGEPHEEDAGGHAHVPAPLPYADAHVPISVWTDPKMIARGKEIYTTRCAVCHGDAGDGKGPAGLALPLKPSDFRDKAGVAEMRDNYWFWRVSEGGLVEPFKSKGSAMPPWKNSSRSRTAGPSWPTSTRSRATTAPTCPGSIPRASPWGATSSRWRASGATAWRARVTARSAPRSRLGAPRNPATSRPGTSSSARRPRASSPRQATSSAPSPRASGPPVDR